jgi:hypothetical protein
MTILSTTRLLIAAAFIASLAPAALAAPKTGWDGTWGGSWGGKATEATSVTLIGDKVVSYTYQGSSTPVSASVVTPTTVSYGTDVVVTMKRTGARTATASLHSSKGDATAELTKE